MVKWWMLLLRFGYKKTVTSVLGSLSLSHALLGCLPWGTSACEAALWRDVCAKRPSPTNNHVSELGSESMTSDPQVSFKMRSQPWLMIWLKPPEKLQDRGSQLSAPAFPTHRDCEIIHVCHFLFYFIEVQLIYNVAFVSGVQHSDSVIHIHVFILFLILFPYRLLQRIE